jgi:hypothetical protein
VIGSPHGEGILRLYKRSDALPEVLGFRLGTLDSDPGRAGEMHFIVGSKAPWARIEDGLTRKPGGVPFGERDSLTRRPIRLRS